MPRVVVLVEPENPLNIGFVARAMKCSGVEDLRIVSMNQTLDDSAYKTGCSAKEILDTVTFYPSLENALGDAHNSIAFSRRSFSDSASSCLLEELPEQLSESEQTALVFGRESQGLFREEIVLCSTVCTISVTKNMSYNLGQAVSVALYETELRDKKIEKRSDELPLISETERSVLFKMFSQDSEEFLNQGNRKLQLRKIVSSLSLTSDEYSLLMGTLKSNQKNHAIKS